MSTFAPAVIPASPPRPPQITLLGAAIRPDDTTDPPSIKYPDGSMIELPTALRDEFAEHRGPAWLNGITYAPENHSAAWLRDRCDSTTIDTPSLPAPAGLALAHVAGGTIVAGTYKYQVTAVNTNGETTALAGVSITTGATGSIKGTFTKVADDATYNVYGRVSGSVGLIGTVGPFDGDEPGTFTDDGSVSPGAAPPSSNTTGGPGTYTNLPIITAIPFVVMVEDSCSTWGWEARDFKGRALRLLENATPQQIEKEWWTGTLAQAASLPNRYLADSNVIDLTDGGTPSVARGQQILQDALAQCGFGGQGMLHVQPQTTPSLLRVRSNGAQMFDQFGNLIVPGVGYPGTGPGGASPDAGTAWIFASDLVSIRVEAEGQVYPDSFAEALDRGQGGQPNLITFRAEKAAVAYADMACQFAVNVTLPS